MQTNFRSHLAIFGFALLIALTVSFALSPGLMSLDSLQQYRQVLGAIPMVDSHPVIMVYTWRLMSLMLDSAGGLLLFNQVMYWTTIALLACLFAHRFWWQLALLIVLGFWPPIFIMSVHVWKDAGMMWGLGLATASIYAYATNRNPSWVLLALFSLLYAAAIRVNGIIPGVILVGALAHLVFVSAKGNWITHWLKVVAATGLIAALFLGGIKLINQTAHPIYGFGTLAVWDIASVSISENSNLLPEYLHKHSDAADPLSVLVEKNNAEANYPVYAYVSPYPPTAYEKQLFKDWLTVIVDYPLAYLKHRAHVFAVLSGQSVDGRVYYPFHPGIDPNELGIEFEHLGAHSPKMLALFDWLSRRLIYRVYVYEFLALAVLLYAGLRVVRNTDPQRVYFLAGSIALSGLVNAASLFFLATAADFRYMIWTVFAAILSALITGKALLTERRGTRLFKHER